MEGSFHVLEMHSGKIEMSSEEEAEDEMGLGEDLCPL